MSLSVSAAVSTVIDRMHAGPVRIVEIAFTGLTVRLCDRVWGAAGAECVYDSNTYDPLVLSWDTIHLGKLDLTSFEVMPGETKITIDNTAPVGDAAKFTELFGTYDPQYATVTVKEFFDDAYAAADAVTIFKGSIEDVIEMLPDSVTLVCSGYELDIANKVNHTIINDSDYPSADPDDIGKMLPMVYGSARKVPFHGIYTGAISTLVSDITAAQTTLELSDASRFPNSGTIISGTEQITYTGKSGNTLTGLGRHSGGTTAAAHSAGDGFAQVLSEYVFAIGHPVKLIDNVYVGNVRQTGNFTAYTGQTGDEHSSYPGIACISFTGDKVNKKLRQDILIDSVTTGPLMCYSADADLPFQATATGNGTWSAAITAAGTSWTPQWSSAKTDDGYVEEWNVAIQIISLGTTGQCDVRLRAFDGAYHYLLTIRSGAIINPLSSPYVEAHASPTNYPASNGEIALIAQNYSGAFNGHVVISCGSVKVVLSNYEFNTSSVQSGVVNYSGNSTADTVIGGLVSADVQGFQDDGSGTYTGTAGALIERPDSICKHFLIDRCGLASSEVDATSYAAAAKIYTARNHLMAPVILQKPSGRALLNRIASQAQSFEFWDGGTHRLIPSHNGYLVASDKTITADRIDLRQIWFSYTDRFSLINSASARFRRDWSGYSDNTEADRSAVVKTVASSIAKYGTLQGDQLAYNYVSEQSHAQNVLTWELKRKSRPRLKIELVGGYFFHDLQRGDILDFLFEDGDELDQALLGLVTSSDGTNPSQYQIIDQTRRADGSIQIQMVEIDMIIEEYSNTDIDTGTETVDSFPDTDADAVWWDYVVKKTTSLRAGILFATWDAAGNTIEYTANETADIGDTSDLVLSVDISSDTVRLRATAASDDWSVKVYRRKL